MPLKERFDRLLLGATIVQTAVGLALLASASWLISTERYQRPGSYFFTWQAATALIGLGVLLACMRLRLNVIADLRFAWGAVLCSWGLLALAFVQAPVANTHRWLAIGGISVQPSVVARVALILLAAILLARARIEDWPRRDLALVAGCVMLTAGAVVVEPDLGSAALLVVVLAGMAFVAGVPSKLFLPPLGAMALAGAVAVVTSPYRVERLRAFVTGSGTFEAGWQSQQSLIAIGSGGLLGKGYGAGLQKLFFLPEPHTDFVFAITGEELGLLGVLALLLLIVIITWRGLRIASRQPSSERALLAFGLTLAFVIQSLIHIVVCLDLVPPKGIPLPLVSYGKTDLVMTLASMGLLLNLSREVSS